MKETQLFSPTYSLASLLHEILLNLGTVMLLINLVGLELNTLGSQDTLGVLAVTVVLRRDAIDEVWFRDAEAQGVNRRPLPLRRRQTNRFVLFEILLFFHASFPVLHSCLSTSLLSELIPVCRLPLILTSSVPCPCKHLRAVALAIEHDLVLA